MSWLLPHRDLVDRSRLDAVLAEAERARERAEEVAREASETAEATQQQLEVFREETRRRAIQREERARARARQDPGLGAVSEVLKLLERRG